MNESSLSKMHATRHSAIWLMVLYYKKHFINTYNGQINI